jgi:hypothetical protein
MVSKIVAMHPWSSPAKAGDPVNTNVSVFKTPVRRGLLDARYRGHDN